MSYPHACFAERETRVSSRSVVGREEIFGAAGGSWLNQDRFDDLADIARIANDSIYGLAASIWVVGRRQRIFRLAPTLPLPCTRLGELPHVSLTPPCPFGGFKAITGLGP